MSGPGTRRQYPCRTCGAAIYSDGTYWRAVRDDTTHCASDSIGHLPDAARAAAPPVDQIAETIIEGTIGLSPEPTPGLREVALRELAVAYQPGRDGRLALQQLAVLRQAVIEYLDHAAALAASPAPEPTGLDAAWAEAEAAMPGLEVGRLRMLRLPTHREPIWQAEGLLPTGGVASGEGPTPAAALRALAARLTGEGS